MASQCQKDRGDVSVSVSTEANKRYAWHIARSGGLLLPDSFIEKQIPLFLGNISLRIGGPCQREKQI